MDRRLVVGPRCQGSFVELHAGTLHAVGLNLRMPPVRSVLGLLVVNDHALFREGSARVLESRPEFHVVNKGQ